MHRSSYKRMQWFIENYVPKDKHVRILDIGSYNVNGSYKDLLKGYDCEYVGADISAGPNVDVLLVDPYNWSNLQDQSFDFIISGNAFEHISYPWLTMEQIAKKLKPGSFTCIITPFNLSEHRYPVDCYRYYPDGMTALARWAGLIVIQATTGGVPEGVNVNSWINGENYDDTVLIAAKVNTDESVNKDILPKFANEVRFDKIYVGG